MVDRLDEDRIEILRGWGAGLAGDSREELRAAGKAITVLVEEIDRLQVDLWNAKVNSTVSHDPGLEPAKGLDDALRERLTTTPVAAAAASPHPGSR